MFTLHLLSLRLVNSFGNLSVILLARMIPVKRELLEIRLNLEKTPLFIVQTRSES